MNWKYLSSIFTKPLFTLGNTPFSLWILMQFILMVTIAFLAAHFLRRLLRTRLLVRTKLDSGIQYLIARIFGYTVLLLFLAVGFQSLGVNLSSLTVLAGALGVGIGFGLQTIVNNFISGLILMGERAIQIGDRIEVGTTTGKVTRIGGRSTSVITNDNITIIVPNSQLIGEQVINWSYLSDWKVRLRVPVGVGYGSEPRIVERVLLEAAAASGDVLTEPVPTVVFCGFGDSSLDFELRVWTSTMTNRIGVFKSDLYFAIWDKFKKHGIEIPFPQRDVHFRNPVQVQMQAGSR